MGSAGVVPRESLAGSIPAASNDGLGIGKKMIVFVIVVMLGATTVFVLWRYCESVRCGHTDARGRYSRPLVSR
jgi:hypothetical protein